MLHKIFIAATWLIGLFGAGGTAVIVATVVYLTPAVALPMLISLFTRFANCTKCVALVVFMLSTTAAFWVGRHGEYRRGFDTAIARIAADDNAIVARAVERRKTLLECQNRNGQWDQTTGGCQ